MCKVCDGLRVGRSYRAREYIWSEVLHSRFEVSVGLLVVQERVGGR